jgi:hypothetical protein
LTPEGCRYLHQRITEVGGERRGRDALGRGLGAEAVGRHKAAERVGSQDEAIRHREAAVRKFAEVRRFGAGTRPVGSPEGVQGQHVCGPRQFHRSSRRSPLVMPACFVGRAAEVKESEKTASP